MIPKILHRVWLTGEPYTEQQAKWDATVKKTFHDWEIKTWSFKNLPDWDCWCLLDECESLAGQSDVVRYVALQQFGGVYLDIDIDANKSFDPLLSDEGFLGWEYKGVLCNAVMGISPNHPAMGEIIENCYQNVGKPGVHVNTQTGPWMVTKVAMKHVGIKKYPREYFYPYGWWERHKRSHKFPDSYTVHHWDGGAQRPKEMRL